MKITNYKLELRISRICFLIFYLPTYDFTNIWVRIYKQNSPLMNVI